MSDLLMMQVFGVLDLEFSLLYWKNLFLKRHENKSLEILKNLHPCYAVRKNKQFSVPPAAQSVDPSGCCGTGCLAGELPPSRLGMPYDHPSSTVLTGRAHSFQPYWLLGVTNV